MKVGRPRNSLLTLVLAVALVMFGAPSYQNPMGIAAAYADDDDDDGGGGGGWSGGGGGERSQRSRARGNLPRFLRNFGREFRPSRPRAARQRNARPRAAVVERAPTQIVAFGATNAQIEQLTATSFRVVEQAQVRSGEGGQLVRLDPPAGLAMEAAIALARAAAPQAAIDANHFYRPSDAGDCGGKPCVAPSLVGWPVLGQDTRSCEHADVAIGLIDTGINRDHPTFAGGRIEVIGLGGNAGQDSERQHGTAVAALLIGRSRGATPGLLPNARLIAIDAFERVGGDGVRAEAFDLLRALEMLVARDVDVINMSLAGPANAVLERLIQDAHGRDIVLVAAAGNEGPNAKPVFPAAYPAVIAVTAVDRNKKLYRRAVQGEHIDLAAPGVNVWTAASVKGNRPKTGTSFAAPFVTAAAALAKASGTKSAAEVERQLVGRAEDLGAPGKDLGYGWGLLNAREICGAAVAPAATPAASGPLQQPD